jgi:hypothetical protein
MAPKSTVPQDHLKNITGCLAVAADTLEILSDNLNVPFLGAICNTTQSLLKNIQVRISIGHPVAATLSWCS